MKWWQWHILINVVFWALYGFFAMPGHWGELFYVIPMVIVVFWIPAYIITLIIRWVRSLTHKTTPA